MRLLRRAALLGCLLLPAVARGAPPPSGIAAPVIPGSTLDQVRAAGRLSCGAVAEPEDWTKSDLHGNIAPFDIEICKAVAVAALGTGAKLAMHLYASALEAGAGLAVIVRAGALEARHGAVAAPAQPRRDQTASDARPCDHDLRLATRSSQAAPHRRPARCQMSDLRRP